MSCEIESIMEQADETEESRVWKPTVRFIDSQLHLRLLSY